MISRFRLDPFITAASIDTTNSAAQGTSFTNVLRFEAPSHDVANSTGNYEKDLCGGKFNKSWDNLPAMLAWLRAEEEFVIMELRLNKRTEHPAGDRGAWMNQYYYYCARQGTGGLHRYVRKHPEWNHKVGTKRTGCTCQLQVKSYPNTTLLLGKYLPTHSHPVGEPNARYTLLSKLTRIRITEMLRAGVSVERTVCHIL